MDDKEKSLRTDIANNLGDIVEGILSKNPNFDNIPVHKEASQSFFNYCEYETQLSPDLKSRFILAEITSGRFFCERRLFGHHGKPFAERYPEHLRRPRSFSRPVTQNVKYIEK